MGSTRSNRANKRAFTLVELLAVLVILSLVVGLGAQGLSSSHAAAQFREVVAVVHDLDRQARIVARTDGPILLATDVDGQTLQLLESQSREIVFVATLPQGITAGVHTTDEQQIVLFDRSGRTDDYRIILKADKRREELAVCGLTGQLLPRAGAKS